MIFGHRAMIELHTDHRWNGTHAVRCMMGNCVRRAQSFLSGVRMCMELKSDRALCSLCCLAPGPGVCHTSTVVFSFLWWGLSADMTCAHLGLSILSPQWFFLIAMKFFNCSKFSSVRTSWERLLCVHNIFNAVYPCFS